MDGKKLQLIFEELLLEYEASEKSLIYEYGSSVPGRTIDDEINELSGKIKKYREEFNIALGKK